MKIVVNARIVVCVCIFWFTKTSGEKKADYVSLIYVLCGGNSLVSCCST